MNIFQVKSKKGVLGLDTVKAVIMILLVMAMMAVVLFATLPSLQTATEAADVGTTIVVTNENATVGGPITTGVALQYNYQRNCVMSSITAFNATTGATWNAANYTVNRCVVYGVAPPSNGSLWSFNYTVNYDSNATNNLVNNLVVGTSGFFAQVPTFFVLLGVVVLILIITIVIIAVTRFSPEGRQEEL